MAKGRRRRLAWWVAGGLAVVVLLAVGGPFVYIHFIEGPAPAEVSLPTAGDTTSTSAAAEGETTVGSLAGTWNVGSGSIAGYRVQEVLVGQNATAVGRTSQIWGSLTIAGSTVTKGSFTVK